MPHCPKCGAEVDEKMVFCPKCGASLQMKQPADYREEWRARRREWREQRREARRQRMQTEKREKGEYWEKTEKHEHMLIGPLIGGLILIVLGILVYFSLSGSLNGQVLGASFLVLVGIVIIGFALYIALILERRHPKP
jgi:uncharacterized membrane protein YvbJ